MVVGAPTMTNSDFLAEIYGEMEAGTHGWVCSFRADPNNAPPTVWSGRAYKGLPNQAALIDRSIQDNTYFCTSVLTATADGEIARNKSAFVRLAVLVLDDVQLHDVQGFSYALQTSPGKFQVGIFLDGEDTDTRNRQLIDRLMSALAARGRSNDASGNACVRYVRLPGGTNTKPRPAGEWQVKLEVWQPNVRWSLDDACSAVGIDLDSLRVAAQPLKTPSSTTGATNHAGEMIAGLTDPNPGARVYHESITRLAASLVAGGMFPGAAVDFLYSLMDQIRPGDPEELRRWESRRQEIPRAVKSAEKFAPEERQPPTITVNLSTPGGSQDEPDRFVDDNKTSGDLQPMDWGALEHKQPEPTQWRLEGWLPEGTVTLLSANGGVGKSNLSLQLGVAMVHGMPLFDLATKPSKVLILSGEDEARTVHFRVANICQDLGLPMSELRDRLVVYDLTQADCVLWKDGGVTERMQWLADVTVATGANVVIIDNASDVFAANENDRTEVRGFMRALNLIANVTRAAVLLLAHVDKASVRGGAGLDSNTTFSGSTAWNNSARSRWAMVRDADNVVLRHEKCNLGPLQEELRIEFDPGSKVFKRFGTSPGLKAAATLVRNTQRAAILKLIGEAANAGANLSTNINANNNAYVSLRNAPGFPNQLNRKDFFGLVRELEYENLIAQQQYTRANRTEGTRLVLTPAGQTRVALGSGAPPTWAQREDEDQ
jgi:archaellum biogenesis ATPase FlaH